MNEWSLTVGIWALWRYWRWCDSIESWKCLVGWITDIIETLFIRVDVSELEKQRVKFKSVATRSSFDGGGGGHTLVLTEQRAVEDLIGAPKRNRHGLSHRLVWECYSGTGLFSGTFFCRTANYVISFRLWPFVVWFSLYLSWNLPVAVAESCRSIPGVMMLFLLSFQTNVKEFWKK